MTEETGIALIVGAVLLGVIGVLTLFILIGFLFLLIAFVMFIVGVVLVATGTASHAVGYWGPPPPAQPYPSAYAPSPQVAPAHWYQSGPFAHLSHSERYCPACGSGNLRISAYCHRCGRVLPPP